MSVLRVGETVLETTIGGEDNEPLRVAIEKARGVDPGFVDELGEGTRWRRSVRRTGESGDHVEGLVEHNDTDHISS